MNKPAKLVLVRHGESEWNKLGLWQGQTDVDLTKNGSGQAERAAKDLGNLHFDCAYSSPLIRSRKTLDIILDTLNQSGLSVFENWALTEKDYGDYVGKNKWEIKEKVGEEEFKKIRRAWDYPTPNGESMKQVYERVVPFYQQEILPKLEAGKNVIIASHGNTLRALVKFLDNLTEDEVAELEFGIGEIYVYDVDSSGKIVGKEIRNKNPLAGKQ